jgi:hypothetical protein
MYTETDFVKNLRKTHCKGCMNEGDEFHRFCNGQAVIHCYLVNKYIPHEEWHNTVQNDISNVLAEDLSIVINKEIINDMKEMIEKYGLES